MAKQKNSRIEASKEEATVCFLEISVTICCDYLQKTAAVGLNEKDRGRMSMSTEQMAEVERLEEETKAKVRIFSYNFFYRSRYIYTCCYYGSLREAGLIVRYR